MNRWSPVSHLFTIATFLFHQLMLIAISNYQHYIFSAFMITLTYGDTIKLSETFVTLSLHARREYGECQPLALVLAMCQGSVGGVHHMTPDQTSSTIKIAKALFQPVEGSHSILDLNPSTLLLQLNQSGLGFITLSFIVVFLIQKHSV